MAAVVQRKGLLWVRFDFNAGSRRLVEGTVPLLNNNAPCSLEYLDKKSHLNVTSRLTRRRCIEPPISVLVEL